jgi:hypothetical protein
MPHAGRIHPRRLASSTTGSCLKVMEGPSPVVASSDATSQESQPRSPVVATQRIAAGEKPNIQGLRPPRNHTPFFALPRARPPAQRDQLGCACWLRLLNCGRFSTWPWPLLADHPSPSSPSAAQFQFPTTGSWPAASSSPRAAIHAQVSQALQSVPVTPPACLLACLAHCIASELLFNSPPTQARPPAQHFPILFFFHSVSPLPT